MSYLGNLISFVYDTATTLNFFCYVLIFLSGLFLTIHNKFLPHWMIHPIWYLSVSSIMVVCSISLSWIFGHDFPLGYHKLGLLFEILFNVNLAAIMISLVMHSCKHEDKSI